VRKLNKDNYLLESRLLNNLAISYDENKEYEQALEYYGESLKTLSKTQKGVCADECILKNNIGCLYYKKGNYELALNSLRESLSIGKLLNKDELIAKSYLSIGYV
jgi:tetratricopeptide (TPR) repeat protein